MLIPSGAKQVIFPSAFSQWLRQVGLGAQSACLQTRLDLHTRVRFSSETDSEMI